MYLFLSLLFSTKFSPMEMEHIIIDKIFSKITSRKKISNIFKKIAIFLKIMLIFRNYTDVGDLIENFEQQIIFSKIML
jgi:hypothetical protein